MLSASVQEDAANKVCVKRSNDDKLELARSRRNQIAQPLLRHKLAVSFECLENEEIAFVSVLVVQLTNIFVSVLNAVACVVEPKRLLKQNFLEVIDCALLVCYRNHRFRIG